MTIYEMITNRIIERMEEAEKSGKPFYWCKPWTGGSKCAESYTTQRPYSGINLLSLGHCGEFITFKALMDYKKTLPEAEAEKVKLKKGCHKVPIFYFGKTDDNEILDSAGNPTGKKEKGHWFMKYYSAFNIEDVENLPSHYPAEHHTHTTTENMKRVEEYIRAYATAENLTIDYVKNGGRCFYRPVDHLVRVPEKEGFKSAYGYYCSVLHELVHSTSKGLGRETGAEFGSVDYCKEELVAEIGSQMLLNQFEIIAEDEADEMNDIAYIKGWSTFLKDGKMEIVKASCQAEKAVKYFAEVAERQLQKEAEQALAEVAFHYDEGFLYVQESADGTYYDYTLYNQQLYETDGGQIDKSEEIDTVIAAVKDIFADLGVDMKDTTRYEDAQTIWELAQEKETILVAEKVRQYNAVLSEGISL